MIKLSIIVPIYKVASYLRKCVDSVIKQDLSSNEYEIILVDDGSPDTCPQICDEYAAEHDNIHVVHRENGGLSAARNSGIEIAMGEYVMFVDSDDYIEPNVLGRLLAQVESEKLDVLRFDYQNVRLVRNEGLNELMSEGKYEVFEPNKQPRYIDRNDAIVDGATYLNTRMQYACYAWAFILRRDIVPMFTEGLHFEDVEWLPRMMLRAKRVNSTITIVYNYFVRQGSITKTQGDKTKILKNVEDSMTIIKRYNQYRKQSPDCKWLYNMQSSMAAGVLTTISKEFFSKKIDYIMQLRKLEVFPLAIADQGRTYKRRARIINYFGPHIFCAIMHFRS